LNFKGIQFVHLEQLKIKGITLAEHVSTHYKKLAKQNKKIWYFGILYTLVELKDFEFQRNSVCSS